MALVSAVSTGGLLQIDYTDVCVDLAEQTLALEGECDGLDKQDMTLLDVPPESTADFPPGFPEEPTF